MEIETDQAFGLKKLLREHLKCMEIARLHGFFSCWSQVGAPGISSELSGTNFPAVEADFSRKPQFQFDHVLSIPTVNDLSTCLVHEPWMILEDNVCMGFS